eukprot:gene15984-22117_t
MSYSALDQSGWDELGADDLPATSALVVPGEDPFYQLAYDSGLGSPPPAMGMQQPTSISAPPYEDTSAHSNYYYASDPPQPPGAHVGTPGPHEQYMQPSVGATCPHEQYMQPSAGTPDPHEQYMQPSVGAPMFSHGSPVQGAMHGPKSSWEEHGAEAPPFNYHPQFPPHPGPVYPMPFPPAHTEAYAQQPLLSQPPPGEEMNPYGADAHTSGKPTGRELYSLGVDAHASYKPQDQGPPWATQDPTHSGPKASREEHGGPPPVVPRKGASSERKDSHGIGVVADLARREPRTSSPGQRRSQGGAGSRGGSGHSEAEHSPPSVHRQLQGSAWDRHAALDSPPRYPHTPVPLPSHDLHQSLDQGRPHWGGPRTGPSGQGGQGPVPSEHNHGLPAEFLQGAYISEDSHLHQSPLLPMGGADPGPAGSATLSQLHSLEKSNTALQQRVDELQGRMSNAMRLNMGENEKDSRLAGMGERKGQPAGGLVNKFKFKFKFSPTPPLTNTNSHPLPGENEKDSRLGAMLEEAEALVKAREHQLELTQRQVDAPPANVEGLQEQLY